MTFHHFTAACRAFIPALLAAVLGAAPGTVAAGDSDGSDTPQAEPEQKPDTATVVPYETRQAPSHRVSLRDDRVYFLKKLEETESGFVLHTMEDETIEVDRSEVAEILELKTE